MITIISKPLDRNESFEFESVNETAEEEVTDPTDKEFNSKISSKSRTTKGVASLWKKIWPVSKSKATGS
jgi:hypothetical protein